jgi:transcription initiation factor IIE alpha subunit
MGSSFVCENCKSVVKYYWPEATEEQKIVEQNLKKQTCPFCGHKFSPEKSKEALIGISMLATKFKYDLQHS